MTRSGVLIMAYGGPNSLDDIPGYLSAILHGRPVSPAIVKRVSGKYRQIGGRSPLHEITTRQVEAVAALLNPRGEAARYSCYLGMLHWSPWIEETVRDMLADGVTRAVSLVMAPHYSRLSVARYHARVADALDMYRGHIEFEHVKSYHDAPGYIQALAGRVHEGLGRWAETEQQAVRPGSRQAVRPGSRQAVRPGSRQAIHTVFSAHSLPQRILAMGDPYDDQVRETAQLVAECAGLADGQWSLSYQSAARSREPWLGPPIEQHLGDLAAQGVRDVLSVPVGFVSDHVETLYDLDIQAKKAAQAHGMRFERPPALNDDALFIGALAELVRERIE